MKGKHWQREGGREGQSVSEKMLQDVKHTSGDARCRRIEDAPPLPPTLGYFIEILWFAYCIGESSVTLKLHLECNVSPEGAE